MSLREEGGNSVAAELLSVEERERVFQELVLECRTSLSSILNTYPGGLRTFKDMLRTIISGEMDAYRVQYLLPNIFVMAPAEVTQKLSQTVEFLGQMIELAKKQK